jgi:hypothetical protein
MKTTHTLYTLAQQADERFSATIAARTNGQRNRWTMTAADLMIPEIREAYRAKVTADEVWLTFLRTSRNQ